jgi:serine/threonine protein kinase
MEPARIANRYEVLRRLGAGGAGVVFLAEDVLLGRRVAIKSLPGADAALLHAEASRLASLQHPHVVTIHDVIESDGELCAVMEYIEGSSLDGDHGPMGFGEFTAFARQMLGGLAAAHAAGLVHRDIKPGNIMLSGQAGTSDRRARILDFGLAKELQAPAVQTIDHSGALTGSIFVMSPEQLTRQPIDHRTDLYSMGCVFYFALTRRNPFDGATIAEVVASHLGHAFHPLRTWRPDLPETLCAWVESLFAFLPADRPESAAAALQGLEQVLASTAASHPPRLLPASSPSKTRSLRPGLWLGSLTVLIVLAGAWFFLTPQKPPRKKAKAVAEKTEFSADERSAIAKRIGKRATVRGTLDQFGEDGPLRFLTFSGASSKDLMLAFDTSKKSFPVFRLKKLVGQPVEARGTVAEIGKRLVLEVSSLDDIAIRPEGTPP